MKNVGDRIIKNVGDRMKNLEEIMIHMRLLLS